MNRDLTEYKRECRLTVKEQSLIEELRKIGFGRVEVVMEKNQPVRIERIRESIMLK